MADFPLVVFAVLMTILLQVLINVKQNSTLLTWVIATKISLLKK